MTSKLTRLTDDELTETLRQATSGYPLPASVEGNLRHAFAELQERRKAAMDSEPVAWMHNNNNIGIPAITTSPKIGQYWMAEFKDVQPLYRHAQPAPASEPVFFIEVEGDDWINAGRIEGRNRPDLGLLPDGINYLYAAPQPVPELTATVERLNASGYEYEGGEVTPQNVAAVVDMLLQQLDDAVQCRNAQPAPVVQCPFPCGWDNLNKLAIQNAAFVACALVAGEPATESLRQAVISNNDHLLKVISACRAAMLNGGKS